MVHQSLASAFLREQVSRADLFNAGLDGTRWRAIDVHKGDKIDETALKALLREAVAYNAGQLGTKEQGLQGRVTHSEVEERAAPDRLEARGG